MSVKTGATVVLDLLGAVDASVLSEVSGFQGTLQRFVQSKVTLDSEWGTETMVYMDDYPRLLRAAQMGERLTNAPHNATSLLGEWTTLIRAACEEIGQMVKLRPALKVQFEAQLCTSHNAAMAKKGPRRGSAVE